MPARYGLNGTTNLTPFLHPSRDFSNAYPSARSGVFRRVCAPGRFGVPKIGSKAKARRLPPRRALVLESLPTTTKERKLCVHSRT